MQHRSRAVVRMGALVFALAAVPWSGARAQTTTPPAARAIPTDTGADSLERRLLQYRELNRAVRHRLERAALLSPDDGGRRPILIEAERYARAAVDLVPDSAHGYFLVAASMGLRAEHESVRQRVRMATEMQALAEAALERDPNHPGAHHVMGRLHLEAVRVSGMTRLIATHLFGSTVMQRASWQEAERHLQLAVELEPSMLVYRLWLARMYVARDDEDAARAHLRRLLAAEPRSELDRLWQREAAEEMGEL